MAEKTIPLSGWPAGVNNIAPEHASPDGSVRAAINMDFHDSGKARRRKGLTKVSGAAAHSLWSDGTTALFVEARNLKRLNPDYTGTVLHADVGDGVMQYLSVAGEIYYSNGVVSGKVVNGERREWGVEQPAAAPTVTQTTGLLPQGTYQFICTYVSKYGEESGCRQPTVKSLVGGAVLTLPQPTSAEVTAINVYMSPPNGDAMYYVDSIALGQTYTIRNEPNYGLMLRTQFMEKMISGELLEYYRGVIYAAVGNIVWYTEPNTYGLFRPAKNYIPYPAEVAVMGAVQDGMYIVSNTTWFMAGNNPDEFEAIESMPYGAAKYSKVSMRDAQSVLWRSDRGIVRGDASGEITNLQDGRMFPDKVSRAATLIKESDSIKQVISVGVNPPYPAGLVASDYWEAEVIRQRV